MHVPRTSFRIHSIRLTCQDFTTPGSLPRNAQSCMFRFNAHYRTYLFPSLPFSIYINSHYNEATPSVQLLPPLMNGLRVTTSSIHHALFHDAFHCQAVFHTELNSFLLRRTNPQALVRIKPSNGPYVCRPIKHKCNIFFQIYPHLLQYTIRRLLIKTEKYLFT